MNWITCSVHFSQVMFGSSTCVSHGVIGVFGRCDAGSPGLL